MITPLRSWCLLLVLLVAVAAVAGPAVPASAHSELTSTTPADGQTVAALPQRVVLTFAEPLMATGARVLVTGPDGETQQGQPQSAGNTVSQVLRPGAAAGHYTVSWRVSAKDGHASSGRYAFSVQPGSAPTPGSSTGPAGGPSSPLSGIPGWASILIGVVALAFGVKVARDARRQNPAP